MSHDDGKHIVSVDVEALQRRVDEELRLEEEARMAERKPCSVTGQPTNGMCAMALPGVKKIAGSATSPDSEGGRQCLHAEDVTRRLGR